MIAATLWAIVTHIQVLPALDKQFDVNGAVLYAEIPPSTRLSLSVVKGNNGAQVKASARWKF